MAFPPLDNPLWNKLNKIFCYVCLIGFVVALLLAISYCSGRRGAQNAQLERGVKIEQKVSTANENASVTRVTDAVRTETEKKELDDAFNVSEDPDAQRLARGCAILRQQGRDTSEVPQCR